METRAVKKGEKYVLNGTKMFIQMDLLGCVHRYGGYRQIEGGLWVYRCLSLRKDLKGFKVGKKLNKMGMRTSLTRNSSFF